MAEMKMIAIKDIALNYDRKEGGQGNIELLAQSIAQVGLINPITVQKGGDPVFAYTIIAGRRRVEAAIRLNHTEIAAVVYEESETAAIGFCRHLALAENINRLEMHPLDEGAQYEKLSKTGASIGDLCERFDRSASHIYQRMKLCHLTDEMKSLFREGNVSITTAAKIASTPKAVQKAIFDTIRFNLSEKVIEQNVNSIIRRMLRMPLDFPCDRCINCMKRTRYNNPFLFPEYREETDYCLNTRCYEKTKRAFYETALRSFLDSWDEVKTAYIYAEEKEEAERLSLLLDGRPLIDGISVRVYHEDFEECKGLTVVEERELERFFLQPEGMKQMLPIFSFPSLWNSEPDFCFAVTDAVYERVIGHTGQKESVNESGSHSSVCAADKPVHGERISDSDSTAQMQERAEDGSGDSGYLNKKALLKDTFVELLAKDREEKGRHFFNLEAFQDFLLYKYRAVIRTVFFLLTGRKTENIRNDEKWLHFTYEQRVTFYCYCAVAQVLFAEIEDLDFNTVEDLRACFSRFGLASSECMAVYERKVRAFRPILFPQNEQARTALEVHADGAADENSHTEAVEKKTAGEVNL